MTGEHRRKLLLSGFFWNTTYQIFAAAVSFGTMLVLVRIIAPAEYGRFSVVSGILAVINAFNCNLFISQALQLQEGAEPDWGRHWTFGFYAQLTAFTACNLLAVGARFTTDYRPVAMLLHLASLGVIFDWPNRIGANLILREVDFRTYRIVNGVGTLVSIVTVLAAGMLGAGAYAMMGGNVINALPFGFYLLVVRGWRPPRGWWRWPDWSGYRPAFRFGLQQGASSLLYSAKGAFESFVLPGSLGFTSIGLLNRSQALFTTTVGRVNATMVETAYPLLPRSAGDATQFARHATLFIQVLHLIAIPGAIFIGMEGANLSGLVYGSKWVAANPIIWPGTLAGLGITLFGLYQSVLLAMSRLRVCFLLNVVAASVAVPVIAVAWVSGKMIPYAWALGIGQICIAGVALAAASKHLVKDWRQQALYPVIIGIVPAVVILLLVRQARLHVALPLEVILTATIFGGVFLLILRLFFPEPLQHVVSRMPASDRWMKLLRYS